MSLTIRLVAGSGKAAIVRQALVVLGTALASALLLVAAGIGHLTNAAFTSGCTATLAPDGTYVEEPCVKGAITFDYLVQPGLRHGVVVGFVLCVVPLLVFVATASRVAARQRDERLAGLRLAGATQSQVRVLAVLDTLLGATAGALIGTALYLVGRSVVITSSTGQVRAVATKATPSLGLGVAVLLVLLSALAVGAALTLRTVAITPFGVVRKAPRRHPRPWGIGLLAAGLLGTSILVATQHTNGAAAGLVAMTLTCAMLGLVASGTWITSRTGRFVATRAQGPVLLLAGRRLEDEPRAQARAMSAVVLVVLSATIGLMALQDFVRTDGQDADFYGPGFVLAGVGMAFSLVVGAAGLLLTTAEGLLERRRTLAAMQASGVPSETLRRAVLLQVALPMLPAACLAVVAGVVAMLGLSAGELGLGPLILYALLLPPLAVAAAVGAAATTLPFLRSGMSIEQLRAT